MDLFHQGLFMAKSKSKKFFIKKKLSSSVEISNEDREMFLGAFYQGESFKDEPVKKTQKLPKKSISLTEEELFLQAFNEGLVPKKDDGLEKKDKKAQKRSKNFVDATLDLHGMSAEDAETRVLSFIYQSKQNGHKTLLIVHGKGSGILKNMVYTIAENHPYIEDFVPALSRFGGGGALIIRVTKNKAKVIR